MFEMYDKIQKELANGTEWVDRATNRLLRLELSDDDITLMYPATGYWVRSFPFRKSNDLQYNLGVLESLVCAINEHESTGFGIKHVEIPEELKPYFGV